MRTEVLLNFDHQFDHTTFQLQKEICGKIGHEQTFNHNS